MEVHTDFPEKLTAGATVYLGEARLPLTIRRRRVHNDGLLLAFESYITPEQVGKFRNQSLYKSQKRVPKLTTGEFFHSQLLGMDVQDDEGRLLGKITAILETGANDVFEVTDEAGREVLLPATSEVILAVDLEQKKMRVHILPGLLDEAG